MTERTVPPMTSMRPYMTRALLRWINDNQMTPHLLVDATQEGVSVPARSVKDGKIVLNAAERAVSKFTLTDDEIRFSARFSSVVFDVVVPLYAILAIYADETGMGMVLPPETNPWAPANPTAPSPAPDSPPAKSRSHLSVVK